MFSNATSTQPLTLEAAEIIVRYQKFSNLIFYLMVLCMPIVSGLITIGEYAAAAFAALILVYSGFFGLFLRLRILTDAANTEAKAIIEASNN